MIDQFLNDLPSYMYSYAEDFESNLLYLLHPLHEFVRKRCKIPVASSPNELTYTCL
jgi:hypothetical protein